ncbi:hypothetical protein LAZ67_1002098, partial [Cordylochernes scorpioides]
MEISPDTSKSNGNDKTSGKEADKKRGDQAPSSGHHMADDRGHPTCQRPTKMVETRSGKVQHPAQERIKAEESAKPQPGATIGRDAISDPVVLNPNIDIPKYDGTEDPRPWIESLEEIGFLYHWADYIISRYATMNMIGSAKTWLNLHKISFTSWENFKSRLIEDFASDANKEEMKMRLNRMQQWNEPAIRFAEDILVLCNKVDPQMEEETKIDWVIGGLKKEYSFALHLNPPRNTNELLEICKKLDLFEKNYQERAEKSKALYNGPRSPRPHHQEQWKNAKSFRRPYQNTSKPQAPAPRYYQNTSKPQAPTPRYHQNKPLPQVSAPSRSYTPNPEPKPVYPRKTYNKSPDSNRNRTEDGRPICFKCNKPGHVARYCRVRFVRIVEEDPIVTQDKVEEEIRMDNGTEKSRPLLYADPAEVNLIEESEQKEHEEPQFQINENVSYKEKEQLKQVLEKYADLFSSGLGRSNLAKHRIDTEGTKPIKHKPYRVSAKEREIIKEQIDEMLRDGIIRPSSSPWSFPVILVKKRDGKYRFCVDYRKLNDVTVKDVYPIPRIDEVLDTLQGSKYFSAIDLKSGYWQVEVEEKDKEKTAFTTAHGLYEFNVMPFGLCNAPATFERNMEKMLGNLRWQICLCYLDDVIIYSSDFSTHLKRIEAVLRCFREANLKSNNKKCQFAFEELEILGHITNQHGIKPAEHNIKAIRDFPRPKKIKEVQSFLGMCSYYRKFIKGFSKIADPLTSLIKKNVPFTWTENQEKAFQTLKVALINPPILGHFDPNAITYTHTDASNIGLGATLVQKFGDKEKVISYLSRTLSKPEQNYSTTEKECLAVVWSMSKLRPYLYGRHFKIVTDHHALCWLKNLKDPTGRLARWALKIQEYNFEIIHKSGKKHLDADGLSRGPLPENEWDEDYERLFLNQIIDEKDAFIKNIKENLSANKRSITQNFKEENGCLYKKNPNPEGRAWLLVVPKKRRKEIMSEYYNHMLNGHLGVARTTYRVKNKYYWPSMLKDVSEFVKTCHLCQSRKGSNHLPSGLLQPIPPANYPFGRIGIDFVGPLPSTKRRRKWIIVLTDYYTKYAETKAVSEATVKEVSTFLIEHIILRHGAPRFLISDRGSQFTSNLMKEVMKMCKVKHCFTTSYHPQTNGLTERLNRTLINMISMYVNTDQKNWDEILPFITHAYNTTIQETTGYSPFFLLFGREPMSLLDDENIPTDSNMDDYDEYIENYVDKIARTRQIFRVGRFELSVASESVNQSKSTINGIKKLDPKYKLKIHVDKIGTFEALVDTGADLSVVDLRTALDTGHGINKLAKTCAGPDGKKLDMVGSIFLNIKIDDETLSHKFVILKTHLRTLILGRDFLKKMNAKIDCKQETIKYDLTNNHDESNFEMLKIKSAKDSIVPECSIKLIKALVETEDGEYVIEESNKMFQTNGLRLARSLINVINRETHIWITNPYPRPLKIMKNQTLAFGSSPAKINVSREIEVEENEEPRFQINENLSPKEQKELKQVLERYGDLFSSRLGRTNLAKHRIDTEDVKPIKHKPYRVSVKDRDIIKEQIDEMLTEGIIRPSSSPWSFPLILVKKRDGKYRFCVDCRKLNNVTVKDVYPIPRIDKVMDTLQGSRYFSAIDLRSGYWQVEVEERDKEKTAFTTAHGLYEFNVMPFGLCNAPATFERNMENMLGNLRWQICLCYLDDVIIYSPDFPTHLKRLEAVFRCFRESNLRLNDKKCRFVFEELEILGYITSKHEGQEEAFQTLKTALLSPPILGHFNPNAPTYIHTDASNIGIGATLVQDIGGEEKVISYLSRTLSKAEQNYSTTEKECLAVVWSMSKLRPYLYGRHFKIVTDHHTLCWLKTLKDPTGRLARWALKIQEYDFDIIHKSGKKHLDADGLSRGPLPETDWDEDFERLFLNQITDGEDKFIESVKKNLNGSRRSIAQNFKEEDGCLFKKNPNPEGRAWLLVVPEKKKREIMKEYHNHMSNGHLGVARTMYRIKSKYLWPSMLKYVSEFVKTCHLCQSRKGSNQLPSGLLQPIPPANFPFERIGIDFVGPLPSTKNRKKWIIVLTDYYTRYAETRAVSEATVKEVSKFLVEDIFLRHGALQYLISDRGSQFTSNLMKEVMKTCKIKHCFTTSYHPQTNGLTERLNRTLINMLSMYVNTDQKNWDEILPFITHAYNTTIQETTGYSPFVLMFGREPTSLLNDRNISVDIDKDDYDEYIKHHLDKIDRTRKLVINNTIKTQERIKKNYDKKHMERSYEPGELVAVWTPIRKIGKCEKLLRKYFGPYRILKKLSNVNYLIEPKDNPGQDPLIVHVSRIKPYFERIDEVNHEDTVVYLLTCTLASTILSTLRTGESVISWDLWDQCYLMLDEPRCQLYRAVVVEGDTAGPK